MEETASHPSKTLAAFAARLQFDSIPDAVMRRAEDLLQRADIAYVHVRSARNNCFQCRIDAA